MWEPKTFEDHLLKQYTDENPGKLFLEISVSFYTESNKARRIDGILIPGEETEIYPQGTYNTEQLKKEFKEKKVHLLEAKRNLDRVVVGQVLVGESLFKLAFNPVDIIKVAVCGEGNPDIEWYCRDNNIKVALYETNFIINPVNSSASSQQERKDIRMPPDSYRYRAFSAGWTSATNGKLYDSIISKKTHANMGNLFGWIYGEQPKEFKKATWETYLLFSKETWDGEDGEI